MSFYHGSSFEGRPLAGLKPKPPTNVSARQSKPPPALQIRRDNFINEDVWNAAFAGDLCVAANIAAFVYIVEGGGCSNPLVYFNCGGV
jgi:hypothetical protein